MEEKKKPFMISPGWVAILLLVLTYFIILRMPSMGGPEAQIPYSQFLQEVDAGHVAEVTLSDDAIHGVLKPSGETPAKRFETTRIADEGLVTRLQDKGVRFQAEARGWLSSGALSWIIPMILLFVFWSYILRRAEQGAQGSFMRLGKSKAKVYVERDVKTTFDDVAGVDEAK